MVLGFSRAWLQIGKTGLIGSINQVNAFLCQYRSKTDPPGVR
jgi:hypothetical protein